MPEGDIDELKKILERQNREMQEMKRMEEQPKTSGNTEVKPAETPTKEEKVFSPDASSERVESDDLEQLQEQVGSILKEYQGLEANIPLTNDYWALRNKLMAVSNDRKDKQKNITGTTAAVPKK